jgi:ribosomal protein L7/L12
MINYIVIALLVVAAILLLRKMFTRPPRSVGPGQPKMIGTEGGAVAAEVDGQELDIDPKVLDEVRRLADNGQKIEAIKLLREATGLGLAEAKNVVESLDTLKRV